MWNAGVVILGLKMKLLIGLKVNVTMATMIHVHIRATTAGLRNCGNDDRDANCER